jgi:hypothetical protein
MIADVMHKDICGTFPLYCHERYTRVHWCTHTDMPHSHTHSQTAHAETGTHLYMNKDTSRLLVSHTYTSQNQSLADTVCRDTAHPTMGRRFPRHTCTLAMHSCPVLDTNILHTEAH